MTTLQLYYLYYLLLAAVQVVLSWRNMMILITAKRWGSSVMLASLLIFSINSMDLWMIYRILSRQVIEMSDGRVWQLFWFSFRNVYSLGYWLGYTIFLFQTKQEENA